ncbi:MAG: radical SAM protein [Hyphomicrobiaceae bacterium]
MNLSRFDDVDPRLFAHKLSSAEQRELFSKYVHDITLEPFDYCNRKCPYCPVALIDRRSSVKLMAREHLDKILDDLRSIDFVGSICLNLFNEPMAHESTYEVAAECQTALPKASVWFNTNGDYINRKSVERLAKLGLKRIVVTLHTTSEHPYTDDIQRKRIAQFTARTGVALHVDRFRPGIDMRLSGSFKGMKITMKSVNYLKHGVNRGGAMKQIPVVLDRETPCDRPFHDLTIAWNGNVYPCCQFVEGFADHSQYVVGNVGNAPSIFALYCDKMMVSFRRDLFGYGRKQAPCSSCADQSKCRGERDRHRRLELSAAWCQDDQIEHADYFGS